MTDPTDTDPDAAPETGADIGRVAGQDTGPDSGTYPGAPESLIKTWNIRRRPLGCALWEGLPRPNVDLKKLLEERVPQEDPPPRGASSFALKEHEIRREFVGFTELAALNALLISNLRKTSAPDHAAIVFQRIWTEEADALLAELPPRWLISSAITFGDHGINEQQRRIGLSMNMLFSLMKLYEFERLYSGRAPTEAYGVRRTGGKALPLNMPPFSLLGGGLDVNLLAQIWQMALDEPIAGRLACHLLQLLNDDPRNLFRRIDLMRKATRDRRTSRGERSAAIAARRAAAAARSAAAGQNDDAGQGEATEASPDITE